MNTANVGSTPKRLPKRDRVRLVESRKATELAFNFLLSNTNEITGPLETQYLGLHVQPNSPPLPTHCTESTQNQP